MKSHGLVAKQKSNCYFQKIHEKIKTKTLFGGDPLLIASSFVRVIIQSGLHLTRAASVHKLA